MMAERSAVRRFEDLIAWQKARELTRKVYEVTGNGHFARDFGLRDLARRCAVSDQPSNVAVQNGNHMVASSPVSALSTQHSYP
jgi:hypothetical protein